MLICWQKNRIALISLNYFLTETCSFPLARTILVKKHKNSGPFSGHQIMQQSLYAYG